LHKGKAQVDYACAGVDTFDERRCKLVGRRAGHAFAPGGRLGKNGADEEGTVRANTGCWGIPLCGDNPGYKGTVEARGAVRLGTSGAVVSNLAEAFAGQIGMPGRHRPINEPIFISELPLVRSINAVSLTKSNGFKGLVLLAPPKD
jgi:hypothetical protein